MGAGGVANRFAATNKPASRSRPHSRSKTRNIYITTANLNSAMQPRIKIKLRGHRKRHFAATLRNLHATKPDTTSSPDFIRVVCISDTQNTRPILPPGDLLIHAGELTENGSLEEVQGELEWLSDQPHKYKVLIAGNHDVLLDEAFLEKYPERTYGQTKMRKDLAWGNVIYLQDSSVTLEIKPHQLNGSDTTIESRKLTIFDSPWTPQHGVSAFQYRPDDKSHWASRFASLQLKPDIVVTHGPPKYHLDARDFHRAGCLYLAEEIARIQPRLVVFGHIHASYGREDVVLDGVQRGYEEIMAGWAGWETLVWMAVLVAWERFKGVSWSSRPRYERVTTFVNAAVVSGPKNDLKNDAVIVEL